MPDYVYALHDFTPEHDDEIAFRAGERIEVIEKDDLYGDGWWQVRKLRIFGTCPTSPSFDKSTFSKTRFLSKISLPFTFFLYLHEMITRIYTNGLF